VLKLTRKLLQGIARALARYASSIERLLIQDDSSANRSISDYSDERPPAHWLAKVRQGAPHLLDNRSGDNAQTVAYSSEEKNTLVFNPVASGDMGEKPPFHWMERVGRGIPLSLDEQTIYKKSILKHFATHDRKLPQPPGGHLIGEDNSAYEEITVKQSCTTEARPETDMELSKDKLSSRTSENTWPGSFNDSGSGINDHSTEVRGDKTRQKYPAGRTKENDYSEAEKPFYDDAYLSFPEKKTAINKTELTQKKQTRPSAKYSKPNSAASSSDRQFDTLRLNTTIPDASAQNTKYQQRYSTAHEQFTITNQTRIKQNLQDKRNASHHYQKIIADLHDFVNKHTITQFGFNETAASNSEKTLHDSLSHKPREQLNYNRQSVAMRSLKADDTTATDISSESNQQRYTTSIHKIVEPFESDLPRWPNLPGEKERRLRNDLWPALPEEEISESDKAIQSMINFAQLQEVLRRKYQNELEQRGMSWNG
jgi:hypothetical protein